MWSNPELTCQHVDPQAALSPGEEAILETKLLVVRASLDDVFKMAMRQRDSLQIKQCEDESSRKNEQEVLSGYSIVIGLLC